MHTAIDYYFLGISPFVYLGHDAIVAVAEKHGIALNPKPVELAAVWQNSGSEPLPKRTPLRQRYRLLEMERIAHWRNLPINLNPAHFPTNPVTADLCVAALVANNENALAFMGDVMRAVWVEERDVADPSVISDILERHGHDAKLILEMAASDTCAQMRADNTNAAIEADATGVPAYVVSGEVFWGQDRIELIDHMLTTGRPAIIPSK
ncbi:MAG: 2-hydroxychromene-2-carboxylate isomerase [Pseudomonadota bacterium]